MTPWLTSWARSSVKPFSKISPKKTWEGTLGGIVLCVIAVGFLYPLLVHGFTGVKMEPIHWFVIPPRHLSTIGDLLKVN